MEKPCPCPRQDLQQLLCESPHRLTYVFDILLVHYVFLGHLYLAALSGFEFSQLFSYNC